MSSYNALVLEYEETHFDCYGEPIRECLKCENLLDEDCKEFYDTGLCQDCAVSKAKTDYCTESGMEFIAKCGLEEEFYLKWILGIRKFDVTSPSIRAVVVLLMENYIAAVKNQQNHLLPHVIANIYNYGEFEAELKQFCLEDRKYDYAEWALKVEE